MSVRRLHPVQPESFAFSKDNLAWAKKQIAKYPKGREASAVIPLLWRAQEQHENWLPEPAIRYIGEMLDMPFIRVLEVATFYTMFQLAPVGKKAHIQVCGTTPCMLRGAEDLKAVCKRRIAENPHTLSEDGDFSWEEVECLGACVNAPMVQVFADTYEDLTPESFEEVLDAFARGETPEPGPQVDRRFSAPVGGEDTLKDVEAINSGAMRGGGEGDQKPINKGRPPSPADEPALGKKKAADAAKPTRKETIARRAEAEESAPSKPAATGKSTDSSDTPPEASGINADDAARADAAGKKPRMLPKPRKAGADDLKQIKGVGPKLEGVLNGMGIYHFDQIAAWKPEHVSWVDEYLKFKGRIVRDDWLVQADTLAKGGETDFSKRVAKGQVPSSKR
ncbi:NADH-quinone oxidoreductase subunit NuoE [Tepidamorphus sp. 3E244]|uniref:NADH-quinone oxidoreductase subunit NuoE n=1 Tax=Tepidamorphus sp. 3E244 TaxID=3385498 RepID=UPI0038FD28DC